MIVGGHLVVGKQQINEVEKPFLDMGFDRDFPPGTSPETAIEAIREILKMPEADSFT